MSYQHEDLITFIYREHASGYPKPVLLNFYLTKKGGLIAVLELYQQLLMA